MAYTTYTYVQNLFKNLSFTSSSVITIDTVEQFIEESDAYIDMKLSCKYEVPLTGTYTLIILRKISSLIVASTIRSILEVKGSQETIGNKNELELANQMIDDILTDKLHLKDATIASGYPSIESYTYNNSVEMEFDIEKTQW